VILAFVELGRIIELNEFAIDACTDEAILREFFELFAIGSFAAANDRREDHDAIVCFADLTAENSLDDLLRRLTRDGMAALRAVRSTDGSVDDAQIIVDLGDSADGGTRRACGCFLLDGNGGREAFDDVDFGTLHLIEELTGVSGERFDIAALAFGVDGVESEGGLAGTGEASDDGQGIARDFETNVLEVVLPRAADDQLGQAHDCVCSLRRSIQPYWRH